MSRINDGKRKIGKKTPGIRKKEKLSVEGFSKLRGETEGFG